MSDFHIVIPARFASTRLPGKPLLVLAGRSMIQRVCDRAIEMKAASVVLATDDQRIADAVGDLDVEICMTHPWHQSGTDRVAEVVAMKGWSDDEIVVNLQGDEPQMPTMLLQQVVHLLQRHPDASIATLSADLDNSQQSVDPHVVKVVTDEAGYALYFSRAPIPWHRDDARWGAAATDEMTRAMTRHIGLYAYRAGFLLEYSSLPESPLERLEGLEQLRALWHGKKIIVGHAQVLPPTGIDTEEDLLRVAAEFAEQGASFS